MYLQEACDLARDITGVAVTPLADTEARVAFCDRWRFHPAQEYLLPQALERLFAALAPQEPLVALDLFQVRFAFFMAGEVPVAVGPYCTEFFSLSDCTLLLRQRGLDLPAHDLLVWRGGIPVLPERNVLHLINMLAEHLDLTPRPQTVRRVGTDNGAPVVVNEAAAHRSYAQMIEERYRLEAQFMQDIREGNAGAAVAHWRHLHDSVAYMKRLGQPLEQARYAAAVTRTTMRMAAVDAGLPAVLNDAISGQSSAIIKGAESIDAIDAEHERLIREYCRAVRAQKDAGHSGLVLSALYHIEHHYADDLTVAELAAALDVTPGYLAARFKQETGQTPGACLQRTRLKHAARLLADTDEPVQAVSARVGIADANYFARLFKRAYGKTPGEYRRARRL